MSEAWDTDPAAAYAEAERRIAAWREGALDLKLKALASLPPELSRLTALQSLDLRGTQVNDLTPLQALTALQRLYLNGPQASDLAPLQALTALEALYLYGTQVSDLAPLKALTALRHLDLSETQVSDLAPLKALTSLQSLDLFSGTQVSDLAPLQALTALQWLDLRDTRVSNLAPLQALNALQELQLSYTQVSDLAPLQSLTALRQLDLGQTQVSDLAPLKALIGLQRLSLSQTRVSDIASLQALTALQELDLTGTQVSDFAPLRAFTALRNLNLGGTRFSDLAPLQSLTALQSLNLNRTRVRHFAPLQAHIALRHLSLFGTQISDLAPLQALTALQTLDLSHTQVSDLAPLQALTNLQSLRLDGSQVSDLLPLANMTRLREASMPGSKPVPNMAGLSYRKTPATQRTDTQYPKFSMLGYLDCAVATIDYMNGRLLDGDGKPIPPPPPLSESDGGYGRGAYGQGPFGDPIEAVTPPADVVWTREGQLLASRLIAVEPAPRRALPSVDPEAQRQQLLGVQALANQLKLSIQVNAPANAVSLCGDISAIFARIEAEVSKPQEQILIVLIKANVIALERLGEYADALTQADKALFDAFLVEAHRLLALYPILREIEDPHNAELVPDAAIPEGERFVEEFAAALSGEEVEKIIGPSVPGVTRDLKAYPWESKKQKIVSFTAFGKQVKEALDNPPRWVDGTGKYAEMVAKVAKAWAIIAAIFKWLV